MKKINLFYNINFNNLILLDESSGSSVVHLEQNFFYFSPDLMLLFCNLLFFITFIGLFYSKNFIILLISFELIFLSIIFQFCIYSFMFGKHGAGHSDGMVMAMFVIGLVAVESAIMLTIYILLTRLSKIKKIRKYNDNLND